MRADRESQVRVGVSACLLGHQVRYDGGDKRDRFLTGTLGRFVEFVAVCPEVEIGLGVPRETLRLERRAGVVHLVGNGTGTDHTAAMREYSERRVDPFQQLSGYVLKQNSPSCGLDRVRVYAEPDHAGGRGIFAEALIQRWPDLPIEEEGGLARIELRHNFVERIFAYHRLRRFFAGRWTRAELGSFHTDHELQLMAHSADTHPALGRLIDKIASSVELQRSYQAGFMRALSNVARPFDHIIVLKRIAHLLRPDCEPSGSKVLDETIDAYSAGAVSLAFALKIMRHYTSRCGVEYLERQSYLEPYPMELMEELTSAPGLTRDGLPGLPHKPPGEVA